jgi:hypothetical protein
VAVRFAGAFFPLLLPPLEDEAVAEAFFFPFDADFEAVPFLTGVFFAACSAPFAFQASRTIANMAAQLKKLFIG